MPLPLPPSAKPPRSITGKPISRAAARASSAVRQARLRAVFTPISASRSMKSSRSSVSRMAFTGVPSTRTPYLSRTPALVEREPAVERGLAAEGEQDRVDLLLDDDPLDELRA